MNTTMITNPNPNPNPNATMTTTTTMNATMNATMATATATATATAGRSRTGGPGDDGPKIVEHALGWLLVVVLAMLVTRAGLL
ncbi:SCO1431 family membrane protein [Streptomyces spongiicola]|nr:SCO1431 family membrane protein [Streptomyces spongiicola]